MTYIEKETAIEILRKSHKSHAENNRDYVLLSRDIRLLNEMLPADVAEVKHGRWEKKPHTITHGNMTMNGTYPTCNLCGYAEIGMSKYTNYCANCGAKMEEV